MKERKDEIRHYTRAQDGLMRLLAWREMMMMTRAQNFFFILNKD